jgi:transcriptional regulator with XRE-family HTH domain
MKVKEVYIGGQLKKIRQRLGLKQQELADKASIPINTIKNVESNRCCSMQFESLIKLKTIGFDLNELIAEVPA